MKKTLLASALAAVLVFAFAGSAFAAGINHSGQTSVGATSALDAVGIYIPWATAAALPGNVGQNSPHGNYTTTTVKCAVCHSVHYAAPGKAPVGSGQSADTLLRMRAADACAYCHATAGVAVNGTPVYNGLGAAIMGAGTTGGNFDTGHFTGPNCSECHTSVHGANADDSVASLQGFLLKKMTATDVQGFAGYTSTNMIEAITAIENKAANEGFVDPPLGYVSGDFAATNDPAIRQQAVGVFCAECHLGAYATNAAGASTNVYGSGTGSFTGHRVGANVTASANWNADNSKSSGAVSNMPIAWAPATSCTSCHDALDDFNNPAFPHAWGKDTAGTVAKMWLLSAADAGSAKTSVGAPSANTYNGSRVQLSDGVCLKCHVSTGGAEGVGITY